MHNSTRPILAVTVSGYIIVSKVFIFSAVLFNDYASMNLDIRI